MSNEVKKSYSEEEKLKAAYVLNMCTVSVSQIVDYNDEYILEQEYEAILNNLDLEQMPKDEALLNIMKELLDTITFFRIYKMKKDMIEKKYQQNVKNALWNAVPNIGLLVAGGNVMTMAVSLASNVGIGYMNYRSTKAENDLEHEERLMELQITAIEQLNALKRELFTTSWRLADEYEFSDKYRLTERQIRQYNEILMDQDYIRRYKRLYSIKDNFLAYPPFWYFLGNAANHISRLEGKAFSDEFRNEYRKIAINYFDYYFQINETSILREDELVASCALEYYELLPDSEREHKIELLRKAMKWAGMHLDVAQICAIDFLRLKDYSNAEKIFEILVNENYNAEVNSQILSSIYAFHYFEEPSDKLIFEYSILAKQQNSVTLFPMPIQENEGKTELQLWNGFIHDEISAVQELFLNMLNNYFNRYSVEFNSLLMCFDGTVDYPAVFFAEDSKQQRDEEAERVFGNELRRVNYIEELKEKNYSTEVVSVLNKMLIGLQKLPILSLEGPVYLLREKLQSVTSIFENIQECISSGKVTIDIYRNLFEQVSFANLTNEFQNMCKTQVKIYLKSICDMKGLIIAETILQKFCEANNVGTDEEKESVDIPVLDPYRLDPALVGRTAVSLDRENQFRKKMFDKLKKDLPEVVKKSDKVGIYFAGDDAFEAYCNAIVGGTNRESIKSRAIAIIDDKQVLGDTDLIFTFNSVIPIKTKFIHTPSKYKEIQWNNDEEALDIGGLLYRNANVNVKKVGMLIQDIAEIRKEYENM